PAEPAPIQLPRVARRGGVPGGAAADAPTAERDVKANPHVRALAIETSARTGSIAAVEDENVVAEEQFEHLLQHAAQITRIIDRLCRSRGWTAADLDELYVSAGPGSFTGLRIGITLA